MADRIKNSIRLFDIISSWKGLARMEQLDGHAALAAFDVLRESLVL